MNEFFNDLGKAFQRAASNVSTEVSIAAQEQKVKESYQTIGRLYFEAVQAGDAPYGPEFDAEIEKIRGLLETIQTKRQNQKV